MINLINKYKAKFTHGSFARNVLIMFTGTAFGQFISVALSPILTRIYSPDSFGILGFFAALVMIMAVVSSLRYDMALPLAKNEEDAANLLAVCWLSLVITTTIFYAFIFALPQHILSYLFGSLEPYVIALPIGFFCIGAYQIMIGYATWHSSFAIISRTKIYQGVVGPVSQIGFGLMGLSAWGLIVGYIIGQSIGFSNMLRRLVFAPKNVISYITKEKMIGQAKRFINFPLVSSWSAIISAVGSNNILLVMIPILYNNTIAGFIFLTDRIIGRPLSLISTSILQVYLGEAARTQSSDPKAMRRRFLQISKFQFLIVSFWLILINSTAFYFVPIIFGKEWTDAVIYIHILSICYLPQMVMISVTHTLQIMEKQGLTAVWEISRLLLVVAGFAASYLYAYSSVQSLLIYSITQAVMQVILYLLMYQQIQKLQPKN